MQSLVGTPLDVLEKELISLGEKPFHARQIFNWVYQKQALSFDQMTNLSKPLRLLLASRFSFPSLKPIRSVVSEDGQTIKFLFELSDGALVEAVLIFAPNRRTVCVSCQVGCPARCAFCASGKQGLIRNLSVGEIVEQVLHINAFLAPRGERVCHIVFMGMGEPLENYDPVLSAVRLFNSPDALNISQRRITLSTVGVVEGIDRLAREEVRINLVLSLHAPNQQIRKKIIPYARKYHIGEVIAAMDRYAAATKRDITYEYTLLEGINDQPEHADELAQLLAGKQCTVNLIPYNPVEGLRLNRPSREAVDYFRYRLERAGLHATQRYTKGKDIAAACGQLALQTKNSLAILA
jgi:23S rRNA (adenine2503-C2)-methyltransferase